MLKANDNNENNEKEHRLLLLEEWKEFEREYGNEEDLDKVSRLMPRKVTKRRQITTEDGSQTRWEEYVDYIFPDDQSAQSSILLLQKAKEFMAKKNSQQSTT